MTTTPPANQGGPSDTPMPEKMERFVRKGTQLIEMNGWPHKSPDEIRNILTAKVTVIKEPDHGSSQHWSCRVEGVKNNVTGIEATMRLLLGGEEGHLH